LKKKQDDADNGTTDNGTTGDNDVEDQGSLPACTGATGD